MAWRPTGLLASPFLWTAVLATVWLVAATVLPKMREDRLHEAARYRAWRGSGPACAILARGRRVSQLARSFELAGVVVSREHGHVACGGYFEREGRGPHEVVACHMITPGRVSVFAHGEALEFDPGLGADATVTVGRRDIACARGANHVLFLKPRNPYS